MQALRWGTTPQKGCVLALPLGVFPGSLHCSRGAAKAPKASALHPVSPAPARTGPPGETGLPARSLCFPPPAPPTPGPKVSEVHLPSGARDLLCQGSAFREAVTESPLGCVLGAQEEEGGSSW